MPNVEDRSVNAMLLFASFLVLSCAASVVAILGGAPPDPSVHWPGHSWIHFMKRFHVVLSIGCFLMELCAFFFSVFALHRTLAGGFDTHAASTAELLTRELEFEFVAVTSYFFAGTMLLLGPVAIRCFCMVQQGLRSDMLAASVMCLIVGASMLILSFFNAHLDQFPFDSYEEVLARFIVLSFRRCVGGGRAAVIMVLAWMLQSVSIILACVSLIETFPWYYYREYYGDERGQGSSPEPVSDVAHLPSVVSEHSLPSLLPALREEGDATGEPAERPRAESQLSRSSDGRVSPVPNTGASVPAHGGTVPSKPWSAALNDSRFGGALGHSGHGGIHPRPVHGHGHRRSGSLGAACSIASSLNSLDTNCVD